ncbi:MAG: response regulator, partial [Ignavibacteria bacterium]
KDNYNLDIVVTGLDAIAKVKEKMYDVILMDINLGKAMTGLEASREIRKIQGCENIPVVALTAYVLNGDREEFLASGCTHYLGKPFTKDDLLGLIQEIAGNRLC